MPQSIGNLTFSEAGQRGGAARAAKAKTPEERRELTAAAVRARKSAAEKIAALEERFEAELAELRAELNEVRAERLAA